MRIYAVADIHGKPSRIERIQKNIVEYRPDVVVNCNISRKKAGAIVEIAGNGRPIVEMI